MTQALFAEQMLNFVLQVIPIIVATSYKMQTLCYRGFVGSRLLSNIVSDFDKTMKNTQITG